eukprot:gene11616-4858_t
MPILLTTYFNPSSKDPKIIHTKVNKKNVIETIQTTITKINLQPTDQRIIKHQTKTLFFKNKDGIIIGVLADGDTKIRVCSACIDAIAEKTQLEKSESKIKTILAAELQFHNDLTNDQISVIEKKIQDVQEKMIENIDKALVGLEEIQSIQDDTDDMEMEAALTKKMAAQKSGSSCSMM